MADWQRWKNIMKCYPFEEKRLAKWKPPYIVQPKFDGVRCRAIPTDTGYLLVSSEENVIFSVPHINEELNKETERLITLMPKWKPGIKDKKLVNVLVTLEIKYQSME